MVFTPLAEMRAKTRRAVKLVAALGLSAATTLCVAAAPRHELDELAWLAGRWAGQAGRLEMEELWTEPNGGLMLGLHRDVIDGTARSFEFLRIESTPAGIVYRSSPNGLPVTTFQLVALEGKRVVFENPTHDFPTRILYWLTEDGRLHARIEGEQDGKSASEEWSWHPVD